MEMSNNENFFQYSKEKKINELETNENDISINYLINKNKVASGNFSYSVNLNAKLKNPDKSNKTLYLDNNGKRVSHNQKKNENSQEDIIEIIEKPNYQINKTILNNKNNKKKYDLSL